jgi:hypothetical protein
MLKVNGKRYVLGEHVPSQSLATFLRQHVGDKASHTSLRAYTWPWIP